MITQNAKDLTKTFEAAHYPLIVYDNLEKSIRLENYFISKIKKVFSRYFLSFNICCYILSNFLFEIAAY